MASRYLYLFKSFAALAAFQAAMYLTPSSSAQADERNENELQGYLYDGEEEVDAEVSFDDESGSPGWHGQQRAIRYHTSSK